MREIKFRAWASVEAKMYGYFDLHKEGSIMQQTNLPLHIAPLNLFIFMQYTGLKDKNGVEIYEGDILKLDDMIFTFEWKEEYKFGFYAGWKIRHISGYRGSPKMSYCEVIGNIYENPELLKETS